MIYLLQDQDERPQLAVSAGCHQGNLTEQLLTIKMAIDHEIRESGFVDFMNLADALKRNGFIVHPFNAVQIGRIGQTSEQTPDVVAFGKTSAEEN